MTWEAKAARNRLAPMEPSGAVKVNWRLALVVRKSTELGQKDYMQGVKGFGQTPVIL
jgi:RNA-binding protein YlmH